MAKEIELSIIIINYNTHSLTLDCIKSIEDHLKKISYEIIIVNNSSRDKERQILQSRLKENGRFKIINSENRGFGAANNLGIESAQGHYLLLLNSDTLVIDDSISKLLNFFKKHDEIGALTPLLYQPNKKTLQKHFYGSFPTIGSLTFRRWQGRRADLAKRFFYSDMVSAASMMIKKETFSRIEGFDENFFMYCEDDDFCRRLVKVGYKNAVLTNAKIIHREGESSSNRKRLLMYYKSQSYYWQKHNGTFWRIAMEIIRWPYKTIHILFSK